MSNNILRFADLGESATRRILAGWCGPLVPEPPSDEHDHRKHQLMYMDCTSPDTVEGHVLTFTYSQWSRGTELVFEDGTPRGVGADVAVGRRVLSWETCWKWIQGAGMDCARPEVAAHLSTLCARALGLSIGDGWALVCEAHPGVLYRLVGVLTTGRCVTAGAWLSTGRSFRAEAKIEDDVPHPPNWSDPAAFLSALAVHLSPKIAALQ